jgi:hypothetical protein
MPHTFEGSIKAGPLSVNVLPTNKQTGARILITLPIKVPCTTLRNALSAGGGPSYGGADVAAAVVSMFRGIILVLSELKNANKFGYQSASMASVDSAINMRFDFMGRESKVFGALKQIIKKLSPNMTLYRVSIQSLVDASGKNLKSSRIGFDFACWAIGEALKSIDVLITGKVMVNSPNSAAEAKTKAKKKIDAAADAIPQLNCARTAAPTHDDEEFKMPSGKVVKISSGLDYFFYDFAYKKSKAFPYGHGYVLTSDVGLSKEQKEKAAEILVTRFKDQLGAISAFIASGLDIFTVSDLLYFTKKITERDIVSAL